MKRILTTLASLLMAGTAAHAAKFYPVKDFPHAIEMQGMIEEDDPQYLKNVIELRQHQGQETTIIVLGSPGGYLQPASDMAKLIYAKNIRTVIPSDAECVSACVLMFAAGRIRYVWEGGKIGVHSASEESGETTGSKASSVTLARELSYYGAPDNVIGKMVTTPAAYVSYLTDADISGWVTVLDNDQARPVVREEYTQPPVEHSMRPNNPSSEPKTRMDCYNQTNGETYTVGWDGTSTWVQLQDGTVRTYSIREQHTNAKSGAWVVSGKTHIGTDYQVVFGGRKPRMVFWNGKENVVNNCH